MKLWKYSGTFLVATGILHTLVAGMIYGNTYVDLIREGLFDTIKRDPVRGSALWFFVCGFLLICWGATLQRAIREQNSPAPKWLGYALLTFAAIGCVIVPVSGFWLFLPQGAIILRAKRNGRESHDCLPSPGINPKTTNPNLNK